MSTPVSEKLDGLNGCGVDEIHEAIDFVDGCLSIQLQVGHAGEEDAIEGCYGTHAIEALIRIHQHYNSIHPSRETSICITKLQEARMWLEERARDRKERGVLHKDKA